MAITPIIQPIWDQLARQSLSHDLPGRDLASFESLTDLQVVLLVQEAAALALEEDADSRREAYEVVARLAEVKGETLPEGALTACRLVLARLANFPAAELLDARSPPQRKPDPVTTELLNLDNAQWIPAPIALESIGRKGENSVEFIEGNPPAVLTNFQWNVYAAMGEGKRVAFSAPTSAGKSYVLGLDLVRRVKQRREVVVYVVPTRALIRQVSDRLRDWLNKANLNHIPLRTTPIPIKKSGDAQGAVFVLTQERLLSLLHSQEGRQEIHAVIVDEAHSIADGSRGILLHSALDSLSRIRPKAVVHFSAPAIGNPQDFAKWFPADVATTATTEEVGPVTQNLIVVEPTKRRKDHLTFSVLEEGKALRIGDRPFKDIPESKKFQVAWFARQITKKDQSTIVYCDGPDSVLATAQKLASFGAVETDKEVQAAVEFLREFVHPVYVVADMLEKGIGMHHGRMPLLVRGIIEDLFQSNRIRFLACTSTLLAGVNLPVRHLVMGAAPARGNKKEGTYRLLDRHEFLNLAGRAGRLGKEFQGTVWVFRTSNTKWDAYKSNEVPIVEPAMLGSLRKGEGANVLEALRDVRVQKGTPKPKEDAMAAASKILVDAIANRQPLRNVMGAESVSEPVAAAIEAELADHGVTLPPELLQRNPGIHPNRIQELHDELSKANPLGDLTPVDPDVEGVESDRFYNHMLAAIQITEGILTRNPSPKQYTYYTQLANKWLRSDTLYLIIKAAVEYQEGKRRRKLDRREINQVIDKTLRDLDNVVRFTLVRNLRAFNDVLTLVLEGRGESDLVRHVKPLHVYLEVGTTRRQILNLIGLGLSRGAAIELNRHVSLPADEEPEAYLERLRAVVFKIADISDPSKDEVRKLLGIARPTTGRPR